MTSSCLPAGLVRTLLCAAVGLVLASCAGSGEASDPAAAEPSIGFRKRRMLMAVDGAIQRLMGAAGEEIRALNDAYREDLDWFPTPVQLVVTHPILELYQQDEGERFAARIEQLRKTTHEGLVEILTRYENSFWGVAAEAGRREQGSDLDTRSGYDELDAKVEAASAQLYRTAGVESVDQVASFRTSDRLPAARQLQEHWEEAGEEQGVMSFFLTPPVSVRDALGAAVSPKGLHEVRIQVMTFEPKGDWAGVEWEFVQARRSKVQKGGIILRQTPWCLDPTLPDGRVPLVSFADSEVIATASHQPRPQVEHPDFRALRNHILVSEFRTALRRTDTGEIPITVGWQVVWGVDYRGQTRVLVESCAERLLAEDAVIPALLGGITEGTGQ